MSSTIDIYTSYRVGTTTYNGSFPFYNNVAAIACSISAANVTTNAFNVTYDLDESRGFAYIIMEPGDDLVDPYTDIPLVVDLNYDLIDPNANLGLLTYYILL
jgi:hypothetical protein